MSFDIAPPKRKPRPDSLAKPTPPERVSEVLPRPQKPTSQAVPTPKKPVQPKTTTQPVIKSAPPKKQKTRKKSNTSIFKRLMKVFLVLVLLGGFGGVGWMIMTGKITLPDAPPKSNNTETVSPGIITRFEDEELPNFDDEETTQTETQKGTQAQDPLLSAQADFAEYINTLPAEPVPTGFDGREYQLLEKYVNDFAF